jgi:hypothetical protein
VTYSITVFNNQYDNKTNKRVDYPTWTTVENLLYDLSRRPGEKGGSNSVPLISMARYKDGSTRANDNVEYWASWCALDVDQFVIESDNKIDLRDKIEEAVGDYYYLCYSTASSTQEHPKFRLVFPLQSDVDRKNIKAFWYALNKELGEMGDAQTKDLSRMFYIPALYPNAYNFFFRHKGPVIDADLLMEKWPYTEPTGNSFLDKLPEEVRKQIIEHRKRSMTNTNVRWSGYSDCPFWPKYLEREYRSISDGGWYLTMYKIMVAIAFSAIKAKYPITAKEIAIMCRDFDATTGGWYAKRPLLKEAERALEYCFRKAKT